MCGIAGASLSPQSTLPMRQFMHALLLHSEERGKVAAGWAFQNADRTMYHKRPVQGGHLSLKQFERGARTGFIHTRNATFGKPEDNENNHPLLDSGRQIVLVHNGVIQNHDAIRKGMKDEVFADVDSSVLPALVRDYGPAGLSETTGWAAVAWLDTATQGTLHLARVKGAAPLLVIGLKDGSFVFGSTFQIVHAALIECGYGDQIAWGFELGELTYLQVRAGNIVHMENLPNVLAKDQKFKAAAMSWQEQKRLQAITDGTDKSAPAPSYAPPAPHTKPSYTLPLPSGGTATRPPLTTTVTPSAYKPPESEKNAVLEDPLAKINAALANAPKPQPVTTHHIGTSSYQLPVIETAFGETTETWITYWFQFEGEDKEHLPPDSFDTRSTYEEFREWVNMSVRHDHDMLDWGVLGANDTLVSTKHCKTTEEEQDLIMATVTELVAEEEEAERRHTADRVPMWDDADYGVSFSSAQEEFEQVNSFLGQDYSGLN